MKKTEADPKIIAEWSLACALYRQSSPRLGPIGMARALGSFLGVFITENFLFALPFFFGLVYITVDRLAARSMLMCPNCGKSPLSPLSNESVLDVERCARCGVRLVED
jgi:hypothetical protein